MKFLSDILVKAGLVVENTFSANAATNTIYAGTGTRLRTEANNLVFERVASSGTMKMVFAQGTLSPSAKAYIGYSNATLNLILANEYATAGLELRTSDIIRQQIFANGNIVIGQASPVDAGYKVDISGTVRATGAVKFDNLIGTGTRMVVADGSGVLSTQALVNSAAVLPVGGTTGQILAKIDNTNYNTEWIDNYTGTVKHVVKAGVALTKGQAVYVSSADGTNMIVSKASNAAESTSSKTMGLIAQSLNANDSGYVVTEGLLSGLDTSATQAGDPVWLGTDGNLIFGLANKPYAPNHLVFIGIVTRVNANNGEIFVKVQNGFELNEIHDVDLKTTTPVNGHLLGFNGTLWVNKTIAGWLGYTPANDANVVHLTGNESITGNKSFSNSTTNPAITVSNSNNGSHGIFSTNTSGGSGIYSGNSGSGSGIVSSNGSIGTGIWSGNGGTGKGIHSYNGGTGFGIFSENVGSGINVYLTSIGTGKGLVINNTTTATGMPFTVSKNSVDKFTINDAGEATGVKFIKSGGTSSQFLMADGSVDSNTYATTSQLHNAVTIGTANGLSLSTQALSLGLASASTTGALSSTDWNTFNGKQSALTNPVTGTGTTNYLPKFTGASTIGNSIVQDSGSLVTIGGSLTVTGNVTIRPTSGYNAYFQTSGTALRINYLNDALSANVSATYRATDFGWQDGSGNGVLTLNASGNLGLGVTPSAWNTFKAIEIGGLGNGIAGVSNQVVVFSNAYWNSGYKYASTGAATNYDQVTGQHRWFNAPSGTAGNAITFTQAMTLNASGNLSIGNTNDSFKLDVSGVGRFGSQLLVTGSTNEQLVLSYTTASGGFTWQSFRLNGTNRYRIFGNTDNSFTLWSDILSSNVFSIASTGAATFSSTLRANSEIYTYTGSNFGYWGVDNGNSYVYLGTNSSGFGLSLQTAGTERMRITSGGNVGIGTQSPTSTSGYATLTVGGGGATRGQITWNSGTTAIGYAYNDGTNMNIGSNAALIFATTVGATERMRITSGGNVGIGTTSPSNRLSVYESTGSTTSTMDFSTIGNSIKGHIGMWSNNFYITSNWFYNGSQNADNTGYGLNAIGFDNSGFMSFLTSPAGSNYVSERMRITSTGNVGIGTMSPSHKFSVAGSSGTIMSLNGSDADLLMNLTSGVALLTPTSGILAFGTLSTERMRITSGGEVLIGTTSDVGDYKLQVNGRILATDSIYSNGDVIAYASSDIRLKDNILPIKNALEKVKKIGGYTFDWNNKQTTYEGHDVGVIAQEIEAVLPEVVTTRDNGYKAVKYEKLTALLIESIKEQQVQIERLELLINKLTK